MTTFKNRNLRKIQKSHGVYYVSIPIDIVREMRLREKQKVVFEYDKKRKRMIIVDWKK